MQAWTREAVVSRLLSRIACTNLWQDELLCSHAQGTVIDEYSFVGRGNQINFILMYVSLLP